eukprot:405678-Prymnesium_polylepis.1
MLDSRVQHERGDDAVQVGSGQSPQTIVDLLRAKAANTVGIEEGEEFLTHSLISIRLASWYPGYHRMHGLGRLAQTQHAAEPRPSILLVAAFVRWRHHARKHIVGGLVVGRQLDDLARSIAHFHVEGRMPQSPRTKRVEEHVSLALRDARKVGVANFLHPPTRKEGQRGSKFGAVDPTIATRINLIEDGEQLEIAFDKEEEHCKPA